MTASVSFPVRIAAVAGLVGALVIGGGLMMLGRHSSSGTIAPLTIKPHFHHAVRPHQVAPKHSAATKPHVAITAPVVHARKVARPAVDSAALDAGLPLSLARALAQHPVVVVQVYDPQAEVDAIAYAEARAGAQQARVGFLPLSVLGPDVSKLTQKFGQVLPDPGILVYARPATLALRIDGFVDKDSVAQAAENASP